MPAVACRASATPHSSDVARGVAPHATGVRDRLADGARNAINRHGTVLAAFVLPKGTLPSARDDTHPQANHIGGGRFEFHGNFELRAMTPQDVPPDAKRNGIAALLRHAPMVLAAQDVDVVIERGGQ